MDDDTIRLSATKDVNIGKPDAIAGRKELERRRA
jgi:hypothetical protein